MKAPRSLGTLLYCNYTGFRGLPARTRISGFKTAGALAVLRRARFTRCSGSGYALRSPVTYSSLATAVTFVYRHSYLLQPRNQRVPL